LRSEDFASFDHLLAMDLDNLALMEQKCPPEHARKVGLLMRFARRHGTQVVPDPYYGGPNGFEVVLDYIEDACDGLIDVALAKPGEA
jgi:protein-tyrosine phosphatase